MVTIFTWALVCFGLYTLVIDWRAPRDDPRYRKQRWWPWGERSWRAIRANTVVTQAVFTALVLAYTFPQAAVWVIVVSLVVAPILAVSIGAFGRPRFLIPPPLR